jgi:3-deoxy-7-phosphoheptulonate synthase
MIFRTVCIASKQPGGSVIGAMLESFIEEGSQPISINMKYGRSITGPCIDWATTEKLLAL